MGLLVRPASGEDLPALSAAWPAVAVEVHRARLQTQEAGGSTYLVAVLDGVMAGAGVVRWGGCHGRAARRAYPQAVETTDLQVLAAVRGRGVGSALVRGAEERALARGISQMALSVDVVDGDRARRLYHRLGYRSTGVMDTYTYRGVGDDGVQRCCTETSEVLLAQLTSRRFD